MGDSDSDDCFLDMSIPDALNVEENNRCDDVVEILSSGPCSQNDAPASGKNNNDDDDKIFFRNLFLSTRALSDLHETSPKRDASPERKRKREDEFSDKETSDFCFTFTTDFTHTTKSSPLDNIDDNLTSAPPTEAENEKEQDKPIHKRLLQNKTTTKAQTKKQPGQRDAHPIVVLGSAVDTKGTIRKTLQECSYEVEQSDFATPDIIMWKNDADFSEYPYIMVRWRLGTVETHHDFECGCESVRFIRSCWPQSALCIVAEGLQRQVKFLHSQKGPSTPLERRILNLEQEFADFVTSLQFESAAPRETGSASGTSCGNTNDGLFVSTGESNSCFVGTTAMVNEVSVIHSDSEESTAALVLNMTQCIDNAASRTRAIVRHADLPFFTGTVRQHTSGTLEATWIAVLAQIPDVSKRKAEAIAAQYPTMDSLMRAYDAAETNSEREKLLTDVPGIGPVISKKICLCFCGEPTTIIS